MTPDDFTAHLFERCRLSAPDEVAPILADAARSLGFGDFVVYLVDYDQSLLVPVPGPGIPDRAPLPIDTTLAGRAFRTVDLHAAHAGGSRRLWVPLLDGIERLGVVEMLAADDDETTRETAARLVTLAAELIVTKSGYGDVFERVRRRSEMTLAAEMQWRQLPPLTFGTENVVISGVLEPADSLGGDAFDYAVDGGVASLAVLDAMGHGLEASLLSAVALGAYRQARRQRVGLVEAAERADQSIAAQFGPERFVTGVLATLDLRTGRFRWLNAGHPPPLLVRGGHVVKLLDRPPTLPLGFGDPDREVAEEPLQAGDRLLLVTDGVLEARNDAGEFFGVRRLADLVVRASAADLPAPETMRRLAKAVLAYQHGPLQDDATTLFVEWNPRGGVGIRI